jgi:hypothetical protein
MSFGLTTWGLKPQPSYKSLLFQFILLEFISSYTEVLNIHQLSRDLQTTSDVVPALKLSINKLAGPARGCMRLFSWNLEDGILSRLKNYCANFTLEAKDSNPGILKMHAYLNQAFISCRKTLDVIGLFEERDLSQQNRQALHKVLTKVIQQMGRFSKMTAKLMQQFSTDENVVFFMLRHKSELDRLYGSQFVYKLINKMYPKGVEEAKDFLLKQYGQRGFDHLIPLIIKKISELKAT